MLNNKTALFTEVAKEMMRQSPVGAQPRIDWRGFNGLEPQFQFVLADLKKATSSFIANHITSTQNKIKEKMASMELSQSVKDSETAMEAAANEILNQLNMRFKATSALSHALFDGISRMVQIREQALRANIGIIYLHNHIKFSQKVEKLLRQETVLIAGEEKWKQEEATTPNEEDLLVAEMLRMREQVSKIRGTRVADLAARIKEEEVKTQELLERLKEATSVQHSRTVEILKLKERCNVLKARRDSLSNAKEVVAKKVDERRRILNQRRSEAEGLEHVRELKRKICEMSEESARKRQEVEVLLKAENIDADDPIGVAKIRIEREVRRIIEEIEHLED